MKKKKAICFDLDGTLAPSKQKIDWEMANLINELLEKYFVAVVTWGWRERFKLQFFDRITTDENLLSRFIPCPNCGARMYKFVNWYWNKLYSIEIPEIDKQIILTWMNKVLDALDLRPEKTWWNLIEDRWSQITFSALGQEAPLKEKLEWDPDFKKRALIKSEMEKMLPNYSVNAWWSTSIDVTLKWIDKAFCVKKITEFFPISIDEILFIWDAVFPGWNDYSPSLIWVDLIRTDWVEHTKEIIRKLIEDGDLEDEWLYVE